MFTRTRFSAMMFLRVSSCGGRGIVRSMTGFITKAGMTGLTVCGLLRGTPRHGGDPAMIAPFFVGMIADRFFSTERVLCVLHLSGGVFLIAAPLCGPAVSNDDRPPPPASEPVSINSLLHDLSAYKQPFTHPVVRAHSSDTWPTLGLSRRCRSTPGKPGARSFAVRVLGTIGWIIGNIAIGFLPDADRSPGQFFLAGGAAILLGLYSLTLPHTPPPSKGGRPRLVDSRPRLVPLDSAIRRTRCSSSVRF